MNKRLLKDLTNEELKKVWDANEKLREELYEIYYEDAMRLQQEEGDFFLDTRNNNGFSIEDYYNSFYLRLRNGYKFLLGCNLKDILDCGLITRQEFEDANNLISQYEDITPYTDIAYCDEMDAKIDTLAKEILQKVEKYLHTFEDIKEDDVFENFSMSVADSECFEDCYIKENEGYKLYRDIAYTKCYA